MKFQTSQTNFLHDIGFGTIYKCHWLHTIFQTSLNIVKANIYVQGHTTNCLQEITRSQIYLQNGIYFLAQHNKTSNLSDNKKRRN